MPMAEFLSMWPFWDRVHHAAFRKVCDPPSTARPVSGQSWDRSWCRHWWTNHLRVWLGSGSDEIQWVWKGGGDYPTHWWSFSVFRLWDYSGAIAIRCDGLSTKLWPRGLHFERSTMGLQWWDRWATTCTHWESWPQTRLYSCALCWRWPRRGSRLWFAWHTLGLHTTFLGSLPFAKYGSHQGWLAWDLSDPYPSRRDCTCTCYFDHCKFMAWASATARIWELWHWPLPGRVLSSKWHLLFWGAEFGLLNCGLS